MPINGYCVSLFLFDKRPREGCCAFVACDIGFIENNMKFVDGNVKVIFSGFQSINRDVEFVRGKFFDFAKCVKYCKMRVNAKYI